MESITVRLVVGEDHRIVIDLPSELPIGLVEVTVYPLENSESSSRAAARRHIQAKLRTAGILNTIHSAPANANLLTSDERVRLGTLFCEPDKKK